jgi:Tetratricopeptide repeat
MEATCSDEAEPLSRRAIAIGEETLGPEHSDLAARAQHRAAGRMAEAEPLYRRALAITATAHGPEHHALAATW